MSISVSFEPKEGYLRAEVTGEFTLAEACRTFREALEVVHGFGATRVLVDCLGLGGRPTTMDSYQYGEFIAAELLQHLNAGKARVRLAYLAREPLVDPSHLAETVARNRAAQVAFVNTAEEALAWLGVGPGGQAGGRPKTSRPASAKALGGGARSP